MKSELTALFQTYFSKNRGSTDGIPNYGVVVTGISEDHRTIEVSLIFQTGRNYCCGEPGCHFGPNWSRLRDLAAAEGIELGLPLTIQLSCVVEAGSHFEVNRSFGFPTENKSYHYSQTFCESPSAQ